MKNISVRPAKEADLPTLAQWFPTNRPNRFRAYWQLQERGWITYLIIWLDQRPIGQGTLRWLGPRDSVVAAAYPDCPELLGFGVSPEFQSQGIGSQLLEDYEVRAKERGCAIVGLAVGVENPRAQALYRRVGYTPVPLPSYIDRWSWRNEAGEKMWVDDECIFMVKHL